MFFEENDSKIISAERVNLGDDIEVVFDNGKGVKTLKFNLLTGVSNIKEIFIENKWLINSFLQTTFSCIQV